MTAKTTSDGIPLAKWARVLSMATEIANSRISNDDVSAKKWRDKLLSLLRELIVKYGEKPSLLATVADYIDDVNESQRLFELAYHNASLLSDIQNMTYTAHSLADIHVRSTHDVKQAKKWIKKLETCLKKYSEDFEVQDLKSLRLEMCGEIRNDPDT